MDEKTLTKLEDHKFRQTHGLFGSIEENFWFIANSPRNQRSRDSIQWIAPYMKVLRRYGRECEHITEFGVNQVNSTYAFLVAKPKKLVSVDIDLHRRPTQRVPSFNKVNLWLKWAEVLAKYCNIVFEPIEASSLNIEIERTDLLFIDSNHSTEHLRAELQKHKGFVGKYLILHDTTLFERQLMPPITELLSDGEFEIVEHLKESPGLMVLRRKHT